MIEVEPLILTKDEEVQRRLALLGYRYVGLHEKNSDEIIMKLRVRGSRVILWNERIVTLNDGSKIQLLQSKVYNARFTLATAPLYGDMRSFREYVRKNQSKLNAVGLNFKEMKRLFLQESTFFADSLSRLARLVRGLEIGLLPFSAAERSTELVSPLAYESLLSIIMNRDEPEKALRTKRVYDQLQVVAT